MSVTSPFLIQPSLFTLLVPGSCGCPQAHRLTHTLLVPGSMAHAHRLTDLHTLPHSLSAPSCSHTSLCPAPQHCLLISTLLLYTHSLPYLPDTHTHMLPPSPLPNVTSPDSQIQGAGLATKHQKEGLGLPHYLEVGGGSRSHQANLVWLYVLLKLAGPSLP